MVGESDPILRKWVANMTVMELLCIMVVMHIKIK